MVVVFPLVPVMAMTGTFTDRQPNSSSPIVSMFRDEKFVASGEIGSMPGLRTTKSYERGILCSTVGTTTHLYSVRPQVFDASISAEFFRRRCRER